MTAGGPGGVPAAPNRCRLAAAVLELRPEPDVPQKSLLLLEVRELEPIQGGRFAGPGEQVAAFTFDDVTGLAVGAVVTAEAEYLGGPSGGTFQLYGPRAAS